MANKSIKELGIELQETRSQLVFKKIFNLCKPGVINHYQKFGTPLDVLEDMYNETMISIWRDIDKFDVVKYSISTMIYLKMKQYIISNAKKPDNQDKFCLDDESALDFVHFNSSESETVFNLEDDYIKNEKVGSFWNSIKNTVDSSTYNILYETYVNKMSGREIAKKYDLTQQIVANRIFQSKKKLIKNSYIAKYNINE